MDVALDDQTSEAIYQMCLADIEIGVSLGKSNWVEEKWNFKSLVDAKTWL